MHFFFFRKAIRKLPGDVIREIPLPEPELTDGFGSRDQAGRICREIADSISAMAFALPRHTVIPYLNIPKKQYPVNKDR